MTAASRLARCAATVARSEGEAVTYGSGSGWTATPWCILRQRQEPILAGGQLVFGEDHMEGQIPVASLPADPAVGDTLATAAGVAYTIDAPPEYREAMWVLILRATA